MIKLNLTLGNTVFSQFYMPYSSYYGPVLPKISQHKVVLSNDIIKYYEECARKKGYKDQCLTYIQNMVQSERRCHFVQNGDKANIIEELIESARTQYKHILIAEKEEIKKAPKDIKLLNCKEINEKSDCVLNLYCVPVTSRYVEPKRRVDIYLNWLRDWLYDEGEIIIRDNYLLTEQGLNSFKKYYLPLIKKGASITIQTNLEVEQRFLDEFDKKDYDDYQISVFKCEKMHDRVMLLRDYQIVIGRGISFLRSDWEMTEDCFISISGITIDAKKTQIQQLR